MDIEEKKNNNASGNKSRVHRFKAIYIAVLVVVTVLIVGGCIAYRMRNGVLGWMGCINYSNADIVEMTYDDMNFNAVAVKLDVADIEIKTGDTYYINLLYPENSFPEVKCEGGRLVIDEKGGSYWHIGFINPVKCKIIITVPEEAVLDTVDIDTDAGNISLENIVASVLRVKADAGNIKLKDVEAQNADIDADAGNIDIRDCNIKILAEIKADAGNVELYGNVTDTINIAASCGRIVYRDGNAELISLKADMGSIEVSGRLGKVKAQCSLGSINVEAENLSETAMELDADLGSIKVNGQNKGKSYRQ